jgi:hypothetical protein
MKHELLPGSAVIDHLYRAIISTLHMLYIRFVIPMLKSARTFPMHRSVSPCSEVVMKPNMCSILHRILDFFLLLFFCFSVSGLFRYEYSGKKKAPVRTNGNHQSGRKEITFLTISESKTGQDHTLRA